MSAPPLRGRVRDPSRHRVDSAVSAAGVRKIGNRYHVRVTVTGKSVSIGWFDDEVEAAKAYDRSVPFLVSLRACAEEGGGV